MSQITRTRPVVPKTSLTAAGGLSFFRISLAGHLLSAVQICWHDDTINMNSATKFYFSCHDNPTEPPFEDSGTADLEEWHEDTGIAFTGAAGSAAGSEIVQLGNQGAKWLLVEFNPSADGEISIWLHGKD